MCRNELSAEAALAAKLKEQLEETEKAVSEERSLADKLRAEAKATSDSMARKVQLTSDVTPRTTLHTLFPTPFMEHSKCAMVPDAQHLY